MVHDKEEFSDAIREEITPVFNELLHEMISNKCYLGDEPVGVFKASCMQDDTTIQNTLLGMGLENKGTGQMRHRTIEGVTIEVGEELLYRRNDWPDLLYINLVLHLKQRMVFTSYLYDILKSFFVFCNYALNTIDWRSILIIEVYMNKRSLINIFIVLTFWFISFLSYSMSANDDSFLEADISTSLTKDSSVANKKFISKRVSEKSSSEKEIKLGSPPGWQNLSNFKNKQDMLKANMSKERIFLPRSSIEYNANDKDYSNYWDDEPYELDNEDIYYN